MVVLSYWEVLGEVSELRYKCLLFNSSRRSYCSSWEAVDWKDLSRKTEWETKVWWWPPIYISIRTESALACSSRPKQIKSCGSDLSKTKNKVMFKSLVVMPPFYISIRTESAVAARNRLKAVDWKDLSRKTEREPRVRWWWPQFTSRSELRAQ